MRTTDGSDTRELLHWLANTLASTRMWLEVLGTTPLAELATTRADIVARLNRSIGEAEECCHQLRELLPAAPKRGAKTVKKRRPAPRR